MTIDERGEGRGEEGRERASPARQPAINAPWPVTALCALFLGLYFLQTLAPSPDAVLARFGFAPADLAAGRWGGLVSALFVHGNWAHVLLNTLGALAFGAPVSRLFGTRAVGAATFFAFFLVCGVFSSLAYALLHWGAPYLLVGASGGVSGFMGAASRMLERRGGGLAPFASRTVVGMAFAWVLVNVIIGFVGLGVTGGAPIAWEAHLAGYFAGLLLIGPAARLFTKL